ncbi:MAG: hypothetical protein A3F91_10730 [Flavobacteria bacterium RIFCSPLOWO2_12_FULL_35_11]|nr:MAG: hypothetical protein A3F91_10730 [Flavobacteria bacterium RIFCSPLOWO2_12_FULL_35_11]
MKATYLLITLFFSCSFTNKEGKENGIKVLTIENVKMVQKENNNDLVATCTNWKLSKKNVENFFTNGNKISADERTNNYYFLPCEISGTLIKNDTTFSYSINAGSTGELIYNGKHYAYYGCSSPACEEFVLMMPDNMDPH